LIEGYTAGEAPDHQMSAFAMAVLFQGMDSEETTAPTRAMMV
jgi:pyrimidine-nucleoside phosphorylase